MQKHENLFACRSAIRSWIEEHRQELVQTLVELVRIPSVRGEAAPGAPFGKACAAMLDAVESLYQKYGIPTIADREGGYLLGCCGDGERCIGLFAHGDVVAPGEDWLYTTPFSPIEKDGFLIGRGALDDKSAIVISLACARMLGELALPFPAKLLCYTGFNEESGMQDIRNYRAAHNPPDFALVCDTGYPLYRGNKGILNLEAEADTHLTDILDFYGGESSNITLGKATVALRYSDSLHNWLEREKSDAVSLTKQETMLLLHATGISCHGALPQGSVNAGGILADLLSRCPHIADSDRTAMSFLSSILNRYDGTALGIRTIDAEFGPLTCII